MGTHPIFESDFDCLTVKTKNNDNSRRSDTRPPDPVLGDCANFPDFVSLWPLASLLDAHFAQCTIAGPARTGQDNATLAQVGHAQRKRPLATRTRVLLAETTSHWRRGSFDRGQGHGEGGTQPNAGSDRNGRSDEGSNHQYAADDGHWRLGRFHLLRIRDRASAFPTHNPFQANVATRRQFDFVGRGLDLVHVVVLYQSVLHEGHLRTYARRG